MERLGEEKGKVRCGERHRYKIEERRTEQRRGEERRLEIDVKENVRDERREEKN